MVVIGTAGTIEELKVIEGPPLLVESALEAVKQWRYQAQTHNGKPAKVVTEIKVAFKLPQPTK